MRTSPGRANSTGFWKVMFVLLRAAQQRAKGRRERQSELLTRRAGEESTSWEGFALLGALVLAVLLHGAAAWVVQRAVASGPRIDAERSGKIVVGSRFKDEILRLERAGAGKLTSFNKEFDALCRGEAGNMALSEGASSHDSRKEILETKLRESVMSYGSRDLVAIDTGVSGVPALSGAHSSSAMLGSITLIWWLVMLVLQGEGLELDLQRRRHPMWEWLFAHPVPAGAVFLAEILAPIAANPIYWAAPLFVGILFGLTYGSFFGWVAALLAGFPVSVAAGCLGKALEIGIVIRFSPRSRGALIGIMSWLGYASMMLFLVAGFSVSTAAGAIGKFLEPLTLLPWPWLGWFLGRQADGSFSFPNGILTCWLASGVAVAVAVRYCAWGAGQGLGGDRGGLETARRALAPGRARFGKEPLYRKEFLWFIRDRSAIVQTILIPLTVAGFQLFNLRGFLQQAQSSWNYLCGAAVLIGTYFLWVLGPKSLASEGAALWLALTWPRGLENLLKAKAWLWSLISTGLVLFTLAYAIFLFPGETWKVLLVGAGWLVFAHSMAQKTVTLVTAPSSSGEQEPVPRGRRLAASLGMLTFAIGILTQQWHLAVVGIVYSQMTAAAMWENFRGRLPFLYDPWSEKLPPAPTLMHAMVAISLLVEAGAVFTGAAVVYAGVENLAAARSLIYGICALVVSICVTQFLSARDIAPGQIWCWRAETSSTAAATGRRPKLWWCGDGGRGRAFALALTSGAVIGLILGLFGIGYLAALTHFPYTAEMIRHGRELMEKTPYLKPWYAFTAVALAPFAEEYLFRGLFFRALDRQWGGWRAVVGSAAFFAIYHSPLSWLPVGLLGTASALLFKHTGRLAPCVALHMVYNAAVTMRL